MVSEQVFAHGGAHDLDAPQDRACKRDPATVLRCSTACKHLSDDETDLLAKIGAMRSPVAWLGMPARISSSTATAEQICPGVQ